MAPLLMSAQNSRLNEPGALRLHESVRNKKGKEPLATGTVKHKEGFSSFLKLPWELRKMISILVIPASQRIITIEDFFARDESSVVNPEHSAMRIMLACTEAKDVLYKALFDISPDSAAVRVVDNLGALAFARSNKENSISLARRVDFEQDIFYSKLGNFDEGFGYINHWQRFPCLEKIIVVRKDDPNPPARTRDTTLGRISPAGEHISVQCPRLFEPLGDNDIDSEYSATFQAYVQERLANDHFEDFLRIKVYSVKGSYHRLCGHYIR
ncbi:uncharacterized protein RSE6_11855 [Rhynchosporium secalis]|uniref:2EXR domain-containing protein n=1 Tax=Rhynchosporium secalis TaxID=38038 RepID=A0A1E1MNZ4_RHYSE|nr:uncharacterized protein RSE6_11855 [Rhynchosporium secalis]